MSGPFVPLGSDACDDRDFHQRGELGEHHSVGTQFGDGYVFDGLEQTRLVIEQQEYGVRRIEQRCPASCGKNARSSAGLRGLSQRAGIRRKNAD
jgi:hypothetical protein